MNREQHWSRWSVHHGQVAEVEHDSNQLDLCGMYDLRPNRRPLGRLYDGILLTAYDPCACVSFAFNKQRAASATMGYASWPSGWGRTWPWPSCISDVCMIGRLFFIFWETVRWYPAHGLRPARLYFFCPQWSIVADGARALVKSLKQNTTLTQLDLCSVYD